ncbi:elongation factor P hydroxylase [Biformimicrobium ophioploci]|uniref:elongation factor P hydroxylase n=1 Tax=Biformimicrobium ophioploci TaxID=3036711 RepID=UPI00255243D8|nr:elongation factor P hydroxylase [Microbulbifer sp. NKW57]
MNVFNRCFAGAGQWHTRLVGGAPEPFYEPGEGDAGSQILFTLDYAASALHEVAHWCVAGEARRKLPDYGYWYAPDGRTEIQQQEFERVEVAPQALEWIFAESCGLSFRVSADNLQAGLGASDTFRDNIWRRVQDLCGRGLSERAGIFASALAAQFDCGNPLDASRYCRENI